MCDLLLKSNLDETVILKQKHIEDFLSAEKMPAIESDYARGYGRSAGERRMRALSKRIDRIQRRHFIYPPVFEVNELRTEITLWKPNKLHIESEIKARIKQLIEDHNDEDEDEDEDEDDED